MARNFKIQLSGTNRILFLDLIGDFDGSSAFELLNVLQEKIISKHHRAYINTSRLKTIHPFGLDVFTRNLANVTHYDNIFFTGKFAPEIAPTEKLRFGWQQDIDKRFSLIDRLDTTKKQSPQSISAGGK